MALKLKMDELGRMTPDEFHKAEKFPIVVVLDNIRSMNNIGSFFRTADAFLLQELILCGITATPPHRDIHKTALGAAETVAWRYFKTTLEAIDALKKEGYQIVSVEQVADSTKLNGKFEINPPVALVFGNEVEGVEQEVVDCSDFCVEIPQYGTKHSLNVTVCAGIVIWEFFKKLQ
ncbi:MAG: TrmH family RNA methyltransferase [Bacteroidales bacterium]|jgi:tRNA G18 (ribose-2'-O)-methylase SpoU|nr:TrmH family RNA methyltransferase [Bacteroidales bacterium]